jgi:hypothetical protein
VKLLPGPFRPWFSLSVLRESLSPPAPEQGPVSAALQEVLSRAALQQVPLAAALCQVFLVAALEPAPVWPQVPRFSPPALQ